MCCLVVLKPYVLQDRILQCPEFFLTWQFFLHDLSWSSCNSTISLLINIGFLHQIRLHTSFERPSSLDMKKKAVCANQHFMAHLKIFCYLHTLRCSSEVFLAFWKVGVRYSYTRFGNRYVQYSTEGPQNEILRTDLRNETCYQIIEVF